MNYADQMLELLKKIRDTQVVAVQKLSEKIFASIQNGGIVYVFGSGHSSMLTEEAFHRAGGLVPVYPVMYTFLSPHTSPKISGKLERLPGVAKILWDTLSVQHKDIFILASNSGVNAVAIEMAKACVELGVYSVAFTSMAHSQAAVSRHVSGQKLFELCDLVLDNQSPIGDVVCQVGDAGVSPASSIANSYLWNWVVSEVAMLCHKQGKTLPIYKSANLPGGDAYNQQLEQSYRGRIPQL